MTSQRECEVSRRNILFRCIGCSSDKHFPSGYLLQDHMLNMHSGREMYKCNLCQTEQPKFKKMRQYLTHLSNQHKYRHTLKVSVQRVKKRGGEELSGLKITHRGDKEKEKKRRIEARVEEIDRIDIEEDYSDDFDDDYGNKRLKVRGVGIDFSGACGGQEVTYMVNGGDFDLDAATANSNDKITLSSDDDDVWNLSLTEFLELGPGKHTIQNDDDTELTINISPDIYFDDVLSPISSPTRKTSSPPPSIHVPSGEATADTSPKESGRAPRPAGVAPLRRQISPPPGFKPSEFSAPPKPLAHIRAPSLGMESAPKRTAMEFSPSSRQLSRSTSVRTPRTPKFKKEVDKALKRKRLDELIVNGNQKCVNEVKRRLAEQEVDLKTLYNKECSALHLAVQHQQLEISKALLSNGFSVKQKNGNGHPPLMIAALKGNKDIAQTLLLSKANLHFQMDDGTKMTPLMVAAERGHTKLVELFLENNSGSKKDILNVQNSDLNTPLHIAVQNNKMKSMREMIIRGANTNIKNGRDQTVDELIALKGDKTWIDAYKHALDDKDKRALLLTREPSRTTKVNGRTPRAGGNLTPRAGGNLTPRSSKAPRTPIPSYDDEKDVKYRSVESDHSPTRPPRSGLGELNDYLIPHPPRMQKSFSVGAPLLRQQQSYYGDVELSQSEERIVKMNDLIGQMLPEAFDARLKPEHFFGDELENLDSGQLTHIEQFCTKMLIRVRDQKFFDIMRHVVNANNEQVAKEMNTLKKQVESLTYDAYQKNQESP